MMENDEFKRLATLYLEDAIDKRGQQLLSEELTRSEDRIREFNDMRLLAGMLLESSAEPKVAEFPLTESPKSHNLGPWLAAAAVLVVGVFAGLLLSRNWAPQNDEATTMNLLVDDFEQTQSDAAVGFPTSCGFWSGDKIELVSTGPGEVQPNKGKNMACLTLPQTAAPEPAPGPPEPKAAVQWRIVDLPDAKPKSPPRVAQLCVEFNRDTKTPDPELPCRIELYAFRGAPETAEAQLEAEEFLAAAITHFHPDSDPKSWETAESSLRVDPEAEFLLLGISGFAEQIPQPTGEKQFTGHYADGVELKLINSNLSQTNND